MKKILPHLNTALAAVVVMILSLGDPGTSLPRASKIIPHADKIVHFIIYFSLAMVIFFQYRSRTKIFGTIIIIAFTILAYGILLELMQKYLTVTRQFEMTDIIFNFAGIMVAVFFFRLCIKPGRKEFLNSP